MLYPYQYLPRDIHLRISLYLSIYLSLSLPLSPSISLVLSPYLSLYLLYIYIRKGRRRTPGVIRNRFVACRWSFGLFYCLEWMIQKENRGRRLAPLTYATHLTFWFRVRICDWYHPIILCNLCHIAQVHTLPHHPRFSGGASGGQSVDFLRRRRDLACEGRDVAEVHVVDRLERCAAASLAWADNNAVRSEASKTKAVVFSRRRDAATSRWAYGWTSTLSISMAGPHDGWESGMIPLYRSLRTAADASA